MNIQRLTVGAMSTNCYLLIDEVSRHALIIDPGDDTDFITNQLQSLDVKPIAIIATHGHFDHILSAFELQMIYTIPFRVHETDRFLIDRMKETASYFLHREIAELPPKVGTPIGSDERIPIGNQYVEVIHTPGHTPGSVCLYLQPESTLFVGDTIFASGGVGRTDFSYSEPLKLADSLKTILALPPNTRLLPGHGEETTVEKERAFH